MEMAAGFEFLRKSRQANACLAKGYVYLPKKLQRKQVFIWLPGGVFCRLTERSLKMEDLLQILQKPLQQREVEVSDLPGPGSLYGSDYNSFLQIRHRNQTAF